MSEQNLTISTQAVENPVPAKLATLPARGAVREPTAQNRIALTVRSRRVMRMAPPVDDGFRPFRVF